MKSFVSMKLRPSSAALAVAALLLTSPPAFAQEDFTYEPTSEDPAEPTPLEDPGGPAPSEDSTQSAPAAESPEAAASEGSSAEVSAVVSTSASTDAEASSKSTEPEPFIGFAPPVSPARIETDTMSLRLALIAQPQFEIVGAPDAAKTTKNIYLRRIGFIIDGTVLDYFEYFFDVDYPNLFKVDPTLQTGGTGKNSPGLNVQDVIVTFNPLGGVESKPLRKLLKIDAGFMLPSLSHNAVQGAFTLYNWDYFVNSFRRNVLTSADPFRSTGQSPQGRDAGVQLRGLTPGDWVEYRVGLFQGLRVGPVPAAQGTEAEVGGVNFFRFTGRLQVNLLDGEDEFFYRGTYLGTKKILSFGGFIDVQDQYLSAGGDAILDLPVGPGIITAQANVVFWDGGNFIQTLPQHVAIMAEAGYLIKPIMLSPILRFERLIASEPTAATPSEDRYGAGLAFWPWGHTSNIKLAYNRVHRVPAPRDFDQFNLQWQVWF